MVKINNTFKACALFAGVLYLLYGGRLVNEWRGARGPASSGGLATRSYYSGGSGDVTRPGGPTQGPRPGFSELPPRQQTGGGGGAYGLGY